MEDPPNNRRNKKLKAWRGSKAKELLAEDIKNRVVNDDMKGRDVYNMRPQYMEYPYDRFLVNLRSLQKLFRSNESRADEDRADLFCDMELHPRSELTDSGRPFWDTSEARRILLIDIKYGVHKCFEPSLLWQTNAEYQKFPLQSFRDHIYQETRGKLSRAYWLDYENQKKKKK